MKKLIPKNEFFGALEGTRTPDLLVRRRHQKLINHSIPQHIVVFIPVTNTIPQQ